jgi:hypothetical protein
MAKMKVGVTVALGLTVGLTTTPKASAEQMRAYMIGNSLTNHVGPGTLESWASQHGGDLTWATHTQGGAQLGVLYDQRNGGGHSSSNHPTDSQFYGPAGEALVDHRWGVVALQPYERHLYSEHDSADAGIDWGTVRTVQAYIDLMSTSNADAKVYIYQRWPMHWDRQLEINIYNNGVFDAEATRAARLADEVNPEDRTTGRRLDYPQHWPFYDSASYTNNSWRTPFETRQWYVDLMEAVRAGNPDMADQILMVPVGEVFYEIDQRMRDPDRGIEGFTEIYDLYDHPAIDPGTGYRDTVHLNDTGKFVLQMTWYATLFGRDPGELDFTGQLPDGMSEAAAAAMAQEVWGVVSDPQMQTYTGVPEPGSLGLLAMPLTLLLRRRRGA